ncbi:hydroxyacid dehydrogenase [Elusimicrobiota bacterium]
MPKILISDKYAQEGIDMLTSHGSLEVDIKTGMTPEELKTCISAYDALLVRSATKPGKEILEAADNLKLIVRGGEGTDNIDKAYAAEKGIVVENTPGQNSHAVAELTLGLMFALARHIPRADSTTKQCQWAKKKLMGTELKGKTLGLIGAGKIGNDVGNMAKALGMNVICYEIIEDDIGFQRASIEEVLSQSDYISVHVPLTDNTRNMIGAAELEKMKPTAYILNCARGGIIDEQALCEAINAQKIAGAAIDTYSKEPIPEDNPLLKCCNVILIPHLGASSQEAQVNCAVAAADQVISYFDKGEITNKVN